MIKAKKVSEIRPRLALFLAIAFASIFASVLFLYSNTDANRLAVSAIRTHEATNSHTGENILIVPVGVGFKGGGGHQCISARYLVHGSTGWLSAQVRLTRLSGNTWSVKEVTFDGQDLSTSCYTTP
jgi:hypothetical protein